MIIQTPGMYFLTVCVKNSANLLGKIVGCGDFDTPQMIFSGYGVILDKYINLMNSKYPHIKIDKYIIMPNYIHMIIVILDAERINPFPTIKALKYDISNIVGKFKAGVTRIAGNAFMHSAKGSIWQTSCNGHIIRGEKDYQKIWEYIDANVLRWEKNGF